MSIEHAIYKESYQKLLTKRCKTYNINLDLLRQSYVVFIDELQVLFA